MQALKVASDLAAVGGANLEDTTNAIAAAWRSGIKGAQNFGQAAATVNAIIGSGNMRMQDFVHAMSTGVLSAATTFGVSLKQVGGAMALMTDEGVPAELASTRLRMSLSLLGAAVADRGEAASDDRADQLTSSARRCDPAGSSARSACCEQHLKGAGLDATQTAALLSRAFGGGQSSSAILTMINNFDTLRKKQDQISAGMAKLRACGRGSAADRPGAARHPPVQPGDHRRPDGHRAPAARVMKFVHFVASSLIPGLLRLGGVIGRWLRTRSVGRSGRAARRGWSAIKATSRGDKIWAGRASCCSNAALAGQPDRHHHRRCGRAGGRDRRAVRAVSTFREIVQGAFHGMLVAAEAVWNWLKGTGRCSPGSCWPRSAWSSAGSRVLQAIVESSSGVFDASSTS